jgi:hypothetical protein
MKNKVISIFIFICLILAVGAIWQWKKSETKYFTRPTTNTTDELAVVQNLEINFKFDNDTTFSLQYPYKNNQSLLAVTQAVTQQQAWIFNTENYDSLGTLVTQINDKSNGQEQKYWQYKINQITPLISADRYIVKPDDKIEWEFRVSDL